MRRMPLLASTVLVVAAHGLVAPDRTAAGIASQSQAPASTIARVTSPVRVTVPDSGTILAVEGQIIPGAGTVREFETAPIETGRPYRYTFTATWDPNTYTKITRTRLVSFRGGDPVRVDLATEDPSDRVRVMYVPTPADVAQEMVTLAGVGANDVVFEPGCGDARITIAAVKNGARRGVGIDIDADRVAESQLRVQEAALGDRIEIRLGDALDIKDLSQATVVFLYMGDHFNLLIRPILWRELPVGARVVSHRFTMGDWTPDKTVTVTSGEGGEYELHLWTITEAVKRRLK